MLTRVSSLFVSSRGHLISRAPQCRKYSLKSATSTSPVLISNDRNIYTNLALEHWLYTNLKFKEPKIKTVDGSNIDAELLSHPVVLIWTDDPCIVMGRHQNPWVETNLGLVQKLGIKVARRHSGGGCVYHDENNINISIIGNRNLFENRQSNLRFLADFLKEKYGVTCEPNTRHDLIHTESGLKISGSAAKLGGSNCYHHFTLLVDTDKELMKAAIRPKQQDFITTGSTTSTRAGVVNLKELKSDITVNQVIFDLSQAYGKLYSKPSGSNNDQKQSKGASQSESESLRIIRQDLEKSEWLYGMTPKFRLEQSIKLLNNGVETEAKMIVHVKNGKFEFIEIDCRLQGGSISDRFSSLIGTSFKYEEAMVNTVKIFELDKIGSQPDGRLILSNPTEQILATLLLKIIQEANF